MKPEHNPTPAWSIYEATAVFLRDVVDRIGRNENIASAEIQERVEKIIDELTRDREQFISVLAAETPDNYIIAHQIGVCILSLEIGMQMGFGREKLMELGLAALLFDIGMLKVLNIVRQERKLGGGELDEVKKHPEYGAQLLKQFTDVPQSVIDAAVQHHERPDGKGYPRGLIGREISEFSKIISIADIYIAITHTRPERKRLLPHEAVKELLQNARFFSPGALRSLLAVVSVYPLGTWVELNSHDVGRVVKLNAGQALRPVLELVCDNNGRPLEKRSVVDLMKNPELYITGVVPGDDVEKWGLENPAS